jgi:hypothetical protein
MKMTATPLRFSSRIRSKRFHLGFAQRRGRLIHDQHAHVAGDGFGDLHHLLLGHGERAHQRSRAQVHAHPFQDRARLLLQFGAAHKEQRPRLAADKDVLHHRQIRHQVQFLIDDGNADLLGVVWVVDVQRLAAEKEFAAVHRVDAGEDLHQRRLAGAVLADQPENLAGGDMETHIFQRLHTGEGLADVFHPQQCAVFVHCDRPLTAHSLPAPAARRSSIHVAHNLHRQDGDRRSGLFDLLVRRGLPAYVKPNTIVS